MTKILDSTLRDGSYAFGNSMPLVYVSKVSQYLDSIVDFIEVGSAISFGHGNKSSLQDDLTRLACVNKTIKVSKSVIFIQPHLISDVDDWFNRIYEHKPYLIRIGIDPELEYKSLSAIIDKCHSKDIAISFNLMKAYRYTETQLKDIFYLANKTEHCEYISVIDSSGCMLPNEVFDMTKKISRFVRSNIGIHIHNNSGYANSISLEGLNMGLCVDSTLLGKGRMGGNADTALLILHRSIKKANNLIEIDDLTEKLIKATLPIWGEEARDHIISLLIGLTGLHSSQLKEDKISQLDIIPKLKTMISSAWYSRQGT